MATHIRKTIGGVFRLKHTALVIFSLITMSAHTTLAAGKQTLFPSAETAVEAFVSALAKNDNKTLLSIFGPESNKLVISGDPVDDREKRAAFLALHKEKYRLEETGSATILYVGASDYPFPIPLVKKGETWYFDTIKGKEEILNRRIGENELKTIQTMRAIVDAQREYAAANYSGSGLLAYAGKFTSDPGKKNGLYWPTKAGEQPSPLGELIAKARSEGYGKAKPGRQVPYNGYLFKMLTRQGKNTEDGAFDYMVNGAMIGGFGVLAYPAIYGSTGVMTFLVNHDGIVFQKDLGDETTQFAKTTSEFNPTCCWTAIDEPDK